MDDKTKRRLEEVIGPLDQLRSVDKDKQPNDLDVGVLDQVSERDRIYFETHPGEQVYYRDYVPGEGLNVANEIVELRALATRMGQDFAPMVAVSQIRPGMRVRQYYGAVGYFGDAADTTKTIKPIETEYSGYRFRSRLEARWAIFFDTMGIEWEYEKEGYDLGNGTRYLPDFWLATYDAWLEVKPDLNLTTEQVYASPEFKKCDRLVDATGFPCLLVLGTPGKHGLFVSGFSSSIEHLLTCWRRSKHYRQAVNAARSARFEHGETPRGKRGGNHA